MDGIIEGMQKYVDEPSTQRVLQLKQSIDNVTVIVNAILGIVVWGLIFCVVLVTAMDVVYLTIPLVRSKIDQSGLVGSKREGKIRLVSYDAEKAVENAALNGDVSPLREYLKIRMKTHIFVACMLTVLLCGGWEWLKNFLQPIIVTIVTSFVQF